jgi:hypothetical protein
MSAYKNSWFKGVAPEPSRGEAPARAVAVPFGSFSGLPVEQNDAYGFDDAREAGPREHQNRAALFDD